jgi:hypothetical protein
MFLAGLATLAIIAAVTHRGAYANRLLGNRLFRWIGTRSYGLYLYHWPIYQMIREVAGNKLTVREFLFALLLTVIVTEASYRFVETPIRQGRFSAGWRRTFAGARRGPKMVFTGGVAMAAATGLFVGAVLMTAPLEQNEIARALDAGGEFTTDLLTVDDIPAASSTSTTSTTTTPRPRTTAPSAVSPTDPEKAGPDNSGPDNSGPDNSGPDNSSSPTTAAPTTTVPPTTVPPTTAPPTTTPAPVGQLGVVASLEGLPPLAIPPNVSGFPLVALGDSVMLGAAEELQARGFQVDALQSRQMNAFEPTMQTLKDNGTFGSVVVVHLGTNGGFSQETLDAMLATVADVPVVLLLTGKADRGWIADNNARIRAVPAAHPNVTVVDWEVLSAGCEGRCFYDDGIHLTQSGQDFYADVIGRVLAQP